MSREKGLLHTCDRCGATEFTPFISSDTKGKKETPGIEHFHGEEYAAAVNWGYAADIGELCPTCTKMYKDLIEHFKEHRIKEEANNAT